MSLLGGFSTVYTAPWTLQLEAYALSALDSLRSLCLCRFWSVSFCSRKFSFSRFHVSFQQIIEPQGGFEDRCDTWGPFCLLSFSDRKRWVREEIQHEHTDIHVAGTQGFPGGPAISSRDTTTNCLGEGGPASGTGALEVKCRGLTVIRGYQWASSSETGTGASPPRSVLVRSFLSGESLCADAV